MKRIRRVILLLALAFCVGSVILLLNFTAPNPTGRRYSSEMPLTSGSANDIGLSGEQILAKDLKLPRNDQAGQRKCICSSPTRHVPASECRSCFVYVPSVSPFRRPDFVGPNFIAESKNDQNFLYAGREVGQIKDYALGAQAMNWPLWLYVRVNTLVDPEFANQVNSTGGGVVYYFTVPGYIDPVDAAARVVLLVALAMIVLIGLMEFAAARIFGNNHPDSRPPQKRPKQPDDSLDKARRKLDDAESFLNRAKDNHRPMDE